MVGQIALFDGGLHDPDKHLLAIYYTLERLVANYRYPYWRNFSYILDMDVSADPNTGPDGKLDSFGIGVDRQRWAPDQAQSSGAVPRLPEFVVSSPPISAQTASRKHF